MESPQLDPPVTKSELLALYNELVEDAKKGGKRADEFTAKEFANDSGMKLLTAARYLKEKVELGIMIDRVSRGKRFYSFPKRKVNK